MARHGDGLYLRGNTWYLDCRIGGMRHVVQLGKNIKRTAAAEIASVKRAAIIRGQFLSKEMETLALTEEEQARARGDVYALAEAAVTSPLEQLHALLGEAITVTPTTLAVLRSTPLVYAWTHHADILYVGMSGCGIGRALRAEAHPVDAVYVWAQPSEAAARAQEKHAIKTFQPKLNRAHTGRPS